jgi:hypothetical protein
VLVKIVYLFMRWLSGLAVVVVRSDRAKDAELLVLRHENAVLRRNAGRIRHQPGDRAWSAALTRFIPRRRWAEVFPVAPATLLAGPAGSPPGNTTPASGPGRPPGDGPEYRPADERGQDPLGEGVVSGLADVEGQGHWRCAMSAPNGPAREIRRSGQLGVQRLPRSWQHSVVAA